jgi:hypothetical protein
VKIYFGLLGAKMILVSSSGSSWVLVTIKLS